MAKTKRRRQTAAQFERDWEKRHHTPPIIIYIEDGLVQHVHAPDGQPVRIIDCDIEGSPTSDTHKLTGEDKKHLPDGMEDNKRAFITVWINGEAVARG